jgi:NAD(P)-dependent dehydrogenase (short-subunit alcohol dehydrogenase family)
MGGSPRVFAFRVSASLVELDFAGESRFYKGRNARKETQRRLSGRHLITVRRPGIRQACARALAAKGPARPHRVARSDWTPWRQVQAAGSEAKIVVGDAREEETARQATAIAKDSFGGLDILINNTGVGNYKDLVDTPPRNMTK